MLLTTYNSISPRKDELSIRYIENRSLYLYVKCTTHYYYYSVDAVNNTNLAHKEKLKWKNYRAHWGKKEQKS